MIVITVVFTIFTQIVRQSVRTRTSVPKLQNQATITACRDCGLSEWIIDDPCLVLVIVMFVRRLLSSRLVRRLSLLITITIITFTALPTADTILNQLGILIVFVRDVVIAQSLELWCPLSYAISANKDIHCQLKALCKFMPNVCVKHFLSKKTDEVCKKIQFAKIY